MTYEFNMSLAGRAKHMTKKDVERVIASMDEPGPDDVILAIFALMDGCKFTASREKLHVAFHSLRQKYPGILSFLVFSTAESFPWSENLEDILFHLSLYNALIWDAPDYRTYTMSEKSKEIIRSSILPKIDPGVIKVLPSIASDLNGLLA
jgi:hypothetical protein